MAHWTVEVTHEPDWYESKKEWKQLSAMIRVTRKREQNGSASIERAYYISSAQYDARRFAELIRGHWSIENNLHWQLDVQFNEDASQIHKDHSPENLAVIRKIAKALLQADSSFNGSIRRKQRRALLMHDYLMAILSASAAFV
ncbi:MAG: ISAs1 family transposase [Aristaeellaceae bacterium]